MIEDEKDGIKVAVDKKEEMKLKTIEKIEQEIMNTEFGLELNKVLLEYLKNKN